MLPIIEAEQVASAIYRVEGYDKTKHPYGIMTHYVHTTPRQACINTIQHVARDYNVSHIDRHFIYVLADVYCPLSDDPIGNKNWKHNMVAILHL